MGMLISRFLTTLLRHLGLCDSKNLTTGNRCILKARSYRRNVAALNTCARSDPFLGYPKESISTTFDVTMTRRLYLLEASPEGTLRILCSFVGPHARQMTQPTYPPPHLASLKQSKGSLPTRQAPCISSGQLLPQELAAGIIEPFLYVVRCTACPRPEGRTQPTAPHGKSSSHLSRCSCACSVGAKSPARSERALLPVSKCR